MQEIDLRAWCLFQQLPMFVYRSVSSFFSQTCLGSDFLCTYHLIHEALDHGSLCDFGIATCLNLEGRHISGTPQLLGNLPCPGEPSQLDNCRFHNGSVNLPRPQRTKCTKLSETKGFNMFYCNSRPRRETNGLRKFQQTLGTYPRPSTTCL